jgi:hypothetical protein
MTEQHSSPDEKLLAERLRGEALASRPEFSETLHERINRAVREQAAQQATSLPRRRVPGASMVRLVVSVASVLVVGVVLVWHYWSGKPINSVPVEQLAGNTAASATSDAGLVMLGSLMQEATTQLDSYVETAIVARRWAYLDEDARLTMEMLTTRFPFDALASADDEQKPR